MGGGQAGRETAYNDAVTIIYIHIRQGEIRREFFIPGSVLGRIPRGNSIKLFIA